MTGYVRIDTVNNIADGNVINAADLDGEFNAVQAAFNSSTGHTHDGTASEGAPITKLGPVQDVTISTTVLGVKTTNTVDLGTSSLKFKDFYLAGNASIGGTLGVTGATTLSAALTYGGVTLSNAVTGTGNMVLSAGPTLTGTLTAATITASGTVTGNGNWVLGNADTDTITVGASFVTGTVLRSAKTATNTLALAAYDVDGTAYTNLITLTAANAPTLALTSTGVGTINNMSIGATTASTGAFTTLTSNGATTFTAGTASTTTGTGTLVITGGLGVSGRINAANFDGIIGANTAAAGSFTTLGATGVATFSAGTASLPAITTTGDTNTGIWFPAADTIAFTEGGVESMRIDASGNFGLGVTPSAWSTGKAIQVGTLQAAIWGTGDQIDISGNAYYNSGWKAAATKAGASLYEQALGVHSWSVSGAVTAGNAITFTQAMTLDASGKLVLGGTSTDGIITLGSASYGTGAIYQSTKNNGGTFYYGVESSAGASIINGSSAYASVIFTQAATSLQFGTNNNIRATIDSSGNLGVGSGTTGLGKIEIQQSSTTAGLWVQSGGTTNSYVIADFRNGSNASAFKIFGNARSTFLTTVGVGEATPSTSGSGITFPATQSASTNANTLDDYEEGTTTIYFADATSGGNAYGISAGYIKIGRFVFLQFAAYYLSSPTWTAGNSVYIRNLPFATSGEGCAGSFMVNTTLGDTYSVYAWQPNAATYFVLRLTTFTSPLLGSNMQTALLTYANLVYATDS